MKDENIKEEFLVQRRNDIFCPECGEKHIDKQQWEKILHKKHFCEKCGNIWKSHDVYTFGVE